ncbi:MAG: VOC family protein [Alphaproteobacteria bacterium]|nr:MAG: VOC family protein [Alphaproteobacteria bacterium]
MTDMARPFIWYELMSGDPAAAQAFYTAVVGWTPRGAGPDGGAHYTALEVGGRGVGGIAGISPEACEQGARPGWLGYIGVGDADASVAAIEEAGGRTLRAPDDIPGIGRFAVVADPDGAPFMLLQPIMPEGGWGPSPPRMTPGQIGWRELHAGDGEAAFAFYSKLFGWTEAGRMDMGPMGIYRLWSSGEDEAVGGMMTGHADHRGWLFYFAVDSADAAAARITEAGGKVLMGPMEVPDGSWVVQATDPEGVVFSVVSKER